MGMGMQKNLTSHQKQKQGSEMAQSAQGTAPFWCKQTHWSFSGIRRRAAEWAPYSLKDFWSMLIVLTQPLLGWLATRHPSSAIHLPLFRIFPHSFLFFCWPQNLRGIQRKFFKSLLRDVAFPLLRGAHEHFCLAQMGFAQILQFWYLDQHVKARKVVNSDSCFGFFFK